jgi:hypothetical protein
MAVLRLHSLFTRHDHMARIVPNNPFAFPPSRPLGNCSMHYQHFPHLGRCSRRGSNSLHPCRSPVLHPCRSPRYSGISLNPPQTWISHSYGISIIKTSFCTDLWYSLVVSVTELCFHFLICLPRHYRQLITTKISIFHHHKVVGGLVPLFALVVCCVLLILNVRRFAIYSI